MRYSSPQQQKFNQTIQVSAIVQLKEIPLLVFTQTFIIHIHTFKNIIVEKISHNEPCDDHNYQETT